MVGPSHILTCGHTTFNEHVPVAEATFVPQYKKLNTRGLHHIKYAGLGPIGETKVVTSFVMHKYCQFIDIGYTRKGIINLANLPKTPRHGNIARAGHDISLTMLDRTFNNYIPLLAPGPAVGSVIDHM